MSNILRSMKLWQKFAVLGVIGTVMCAVPLTKLVIEQSGQIEVAAAEVEGLVPLGSAISLAEAIQLHRQSTEHALGGAPGAEAERRAAMADTAARFATAARHLSAPAYAKQAGDLKALHAEWEQLLARVASAKIDARASMDAHTALVESTLQLIDGIADTSGLSLDPVADSYYMITAMMDHLPRLTEAIAQLRSLDSSAFTSAAMSMELRTNMAQLSHNIHYLQSRVTAQIGKAIATNPDLVNVLKVPMAKAEEDANRLHELSEDFATKGAPSGTIEQYTDIGRKAEESQHKLLAAASTATQQLLSERMQSTKKERITLLAQLGALLAMAGALTVAITRSVTKPLEHSMEAANAIASGNLTFAINDHGDDEVAALLKNFTQMQRALQQRKQEDERRLAQTEQQGVAATQVAEEIGSAVDAATDGNFTHRISTEGKEAFHAALCTKFNELIETVSATIREVRTAAEQLSASSNQVSQTSQALSHSASQQAASVEETTASLQEMSTSVKQNSESATVTDGIAAKAAREALEGGSAVTQTVEAMTAIATKIAIIDDIAYQTNLLALNAAIEAARAGEHGKGFAVVAAEVRKLAERSQVAAQEIGALASSSVRLAESAGELLTHMVPSIQKTGELVQEIAAASGEQADGVAQITGAMNHLSSATQQTASASEQLSATAEELSAQAAQLQELMGFFRLADDHQQRPGKARSTPAHQPAASQTLKFGQGGGASHAQARPVARGNKPSASSDIDESAFAHF
jgi:methyl-accepting chemotaxis protein